MALNKCNPVCCNSKVFNSKDLEKQTIVTFTKSKSITSKDMISTDNSMLHSDSSIRSSKIMKRKEDKTKYSDNLDNKNVDHRPVALLTYQSEIEENCPENCPTRKHFTVELANLYSDVQTSRKVDFASIVYVKVVYPEAPCPYVIDEDAYHVFQEFFDPLISDLQDWATFSEDCPCFEFGPIDKYQDIDLNSLKHNPIVTNCEVVVRRNLLEYNLAGCLKKDHRKRVRDILKIKCKEVFKAYTQITVPNEWIKRLKANESFLLESRAMNQYPLHRANMAYKDQMNCNIGAIINHDDHLQIVISINNGKVGHCYNIANKILNSPVMSIIEFQKTSKYGYITYSPQFIGTGLTISVTFRLRFICLLDDVEELFLKDLGLSLRNIEDPPRGLQILYNHKTMGITENDIFQNIVEGFRRLHELDEELRSTSPSSITDNKMPVESLTRLLGKINCCTTARTYTKKYLTESLARQYITTCTRFNGLFSHCIRANAYYPKSLFPKACDPDCYSTFSRFFNPIILDSNRTRHFFHSNKPCYDKACENPKYKFNHVLIKSYRVRFSRNLENFPFPMLTSPNERQEIENKLIWAFRQLPDIISGEYYKLEDISHSQKFKFLQKLNLIPKPNNPIKTASWVYREWPKNRGIFIADRDPNHQYNVLTILVNENDHFQVSCLNFMGVDLDYCYDRAVIAMQSLDYYFNDSYSTKPTFGFLSSNPQNIGCCMRIGAKIYLRYLGADRKALNSFCITNNMTYRGENGSGSKSKDNVFDISLKLNLNYSEIQILMLFIQRIKELILEEWKNDHAIPKESHQVDSMEYSPMVLSNKETSESTETSSDYFDGDDENLLKVC